MMESGEVRKRLLRTIDHVRREAVAHRAEADRAREAFEAFLNETASPVFRQLSQALKAEGYPFQVSTPAGSVRLTSERNGDDFIELSLDTERRPVALVARVRRARGRHPVEHDLVVHEGADLAAVGDEQVLDFVLEQLAPFVER